MIKITPFVCLLRDILIPLHCELDTRFTETKRPKAQVQLMEQSSY